LDIKIWEGGLQPQEIIAIEKIKAAFSKQGKMFPWKGYAGFRFINSKGKEGEFDLVIVTHCNVIIVELKIGIINQLLVLMVVGIRVAKIWGLLLYQ
jgi:hypothetical protein